MFELTPEQVRPTQVPPLEIPVADTVTPPPGDASLPVDLPIHSMRHSGWTATRHRINAAMSYLRLRQRLNPTRQIAYETCGSTHWVQRHRDQPDRFRIVVQGCNDRVCVPCARDRSLAIQTNIADAVGTTTQRMITVSLKSSDTPLAAQLERITACFRRLRHTPAWKSHVTGGVAVIEVTYNQDTRQWHPHLHAITHGRYWPHTELSSVWLDVTGDSMIVHIGKVRDGNHAARYVAKYITKSVPTEVTHDCILMAELIEAFAGKHLLIQFGDWSRIAFSTRISDGQWDTVGDIFTALRLDDLPDAVRRQIYDWQDNWRDYNHRSITNLEPLDEPPEPA